MASVVVSDLLIKDLAREERQKIEVWSEATRVMTSENPSLNMNLILKIIQGNTSIPVILCSETDSVVSYNNIEIPEKNVAQFMTNKVKELRTKNPPIVIDMEDGTYQYLYYDDRSASRWHLKLITPRPRSLPTRIGFWPPFQMSRSF